jgi:hypothetical protein
VTQDTNATQYELMKCFAKAHGGVSVVGDPDQSIYGWRSAEVENLNKMTRGGYFPSWILVILLIDRPIRLPKRGSHLPGGKLPFHWFNPRGSPFNRLPRSARSSRSHRRN